MRQLSTAICLLVLSDAAKFKQLAEEARKLKQAKKQARKERRKAPPKPIDEAAARLAEHRAKVSKQERELQRAKAEQQKAELAAKRKMIQKERAAKADVIASSCDPDEGSSAPASLSCSCYEALCTQLIECCLSWCYCSACF